MTKKKEGWIIRPELEKMLPAKTNKRSGRAHLDELVAKHSTDNMMMFCHRMRLGKKVYCFSPRFVAIWKIEVDKMDKQNRSVLLGEEWLTFSEAAKLLIPIRGRSIPPDKLEEIIKYFSAREKHPDLFRPGYRAKKYPVRRGKLVEMVHRNGAAVLNEMIIDFLKDHLEKLDDPHGVERGRSWKVPRRPNLDQLDGNFS